MSNRKKTNTANQAKNGTSVDLDAIGKRLQDFREARGWKQVAFSIELAGHGLDYGLMTISRIENGKRPIPIDLLYVLCKEYHVDLNELICGDMSADLLHRNLLDDLSKLCGKYNIRVN